MKYSIPVLTALFVFTSCHVSHQKEVQTIDSLITLVDSAEVVLNLVDTSKLGQYLREGNDFMMRVKSLTTTLKKEDAIVLDQYAGVHKAFRKWRTRLPRFYREMKVVPQQLEDLKRDLSRNLVEEKDVDAYFTQEYNAAIALFETINQMYYGLASVESLYLENREKVILLIERLEAEKQQDL